MPMLNALSDDSSEYQDGFDQSIESMNVGEPDMSNHVGKPMNTCQLIENAGIDDDMSFDMDSSSDVICNEINTSLLSSLVIIYLNSRE
jgi:hypothetical protein